MKTLLMLSMFTIGVAATALGATTTDASFSNSLNLSFKCDDTACTGPAKGKITVAETLAISPTEEAELQSDTSVTLNVAGIFFSSTIPMILSDDPNFQNGDKSAKIKKTVAIEEGIDLVFTAQLKWGDGQFDIKVNGKIVGELSGGLTTLAKSEPKAFPSLPLAIEVVRGVTPVFQVETDLVGDVKILEAQRINSTGDGTQKVAVSFKSTGLAPAP